MHHTHHKAARGWPATLLLLTLSSVCRAEPGANPGTMPANAPQAERAAAIARENTGGRVLDVRLLDDQRPPSYAVRLLLDPGTVRTVLVDGDSGQLR